MYAPGIIQATSFIVWIVWAGIALVFLFYALFNPEEPLPRKSRKKAAWFLFAIAASKTVVRGMDWYMGGAIYYVIALPDGGQKLWALAVYEIARFVFVACGLTLWWWSLKQFWRWVPLRER